MQIYTARHVFDGNSFLENTAILVENKIIVKIIPLSKVTDQALIKNFGDTIIAPGFIDLQLNGCGGVLFNNDINQKTLDIMYHTCLKYGTTSFLPTLITCDFKDVIQALETIKIWFDKYGSNNGILGLHLEGPFISVAKKGTHPEKFIIKPTFNLLAKIVAYRQYFPIKMTIAVEEFSNDQIQFLIDNDILLSVGHSNASYTQVGIAIELGIKTATHTFNAMSGLTGRNPGVIGAVFNSNIYNGIIADMLHVDKANVEFLSKLKPERTYLVTDAVTPMGTNMTEFELGGKTLSVKDGQCIDENGILGGANLTMPQAIVNCVNYSHVSLAQALRMASLIPARLMGYDNCLGKIARGFRANLTTFDLSTNSCQIIT